MKKEAKPHICNDLVVVMFEENPYNYLNDLLKLNFCDYPMPGDVNGNCVFNFVDFPIMAPHWFEEAWYH